MDSKIVSSKFLWVFVGLLLMVGCQQSRVPRLPLYIGHVEGLHDVQGHRPQSLPSPINKVGVILITDSSFPNAAPSLSPAMLEILENRLVKKMNEYFALEVQAIRFDQPLQPTGDVTSMTHLAKSHNLDFMLLAILSSTEIVSHIEIGEETMMTRMSGVEIENAGKAELALLHVDSGHLALHAAGEGSDSMEQLEVPIGADYPRKEDAKDILRANAAEKALDQALLSLQRQWGRSLVIGG